MWKEGIKSGEERDFETRMRVASTTRSGTYPIGVTLSCGGTKTATPRRCKRRSLSRLPVRSPSGRSSRCSMFGLPGRVAPGAPFSVVFDLQKHRRA